jgi:type I restriction enzyme S subunit
MKPINFKRGYTNYLLKGYSFIEEFYRNGHGIVADLWTTRYDEMKNIKIPIPPKEEQTAIANFLDNKTTKIDQAIAQKEKLIELLKERKQILIQNAVTGKVVWNKEKNVWTEPVEVKDSGVEWIGEIPKHWGVQGTKVYFKRKK